MAKAQIDTTEYNEIENKIIQASEAMEEVESLWGENFDNLNQAFIGSGFLDDLYEDAESNYQTLKKGASFVASTLGGAALGLSFGPIGGIVGAVAGAILGIVNCVVSDPEWLTVSKEVFEQLLNNCQVGADNSYIEIINLQTKLYNAQVSLEKVKTIINEFQQTYANLEATAADCGVTLNLASDGMTVLGISTEVTVNGETMETTTSEAMNAFFTYENTVMASEIEATYLYENYGIDINFNDIVTNANGFIADTLRAGLYTHEFVGIGTEGSGYETPGVMANYTPDSSKAFENATSATGLSSDELQSALDSLDGLGDLALAGGLIGSNYYLGKIGDGEDAANAIDSPTDDSSNNNSSSGGPSSSSSSSSPGSTTTTSVKTESPTEAETEAETEVPTTPENEVSIEDPVEVELPEDSYKLEEDYDKIAREEYEYGSSGEDTYEFTSKIKDAYANEDLTEIKEDLEDMGFTGTLIKEIVEDEDLTTKLLTINEFGVENSTKIAEIKAAFESGNLDSLREELASYGFSDEQITKILKDEDLTINILGKDLDSSVQEIIDHQQELYDSVESAYDSGDLDSIRSLLEDYGLSSTEIDTILQDKQLTLKSVLYCDKREILAEKAKALAAADGIENYESIYETDVDLSELNNTGPNELLMISSEDEACRTAYTDMIAAKQSYKAAITETNEALQLTRETKTAMEEIQAKYAEEYDTTDTTKWTEEAANEYNEAIKSYNEAANRYNEKAESLETAKTEYSEARETFENAENDYYQKIKDDSETEVEVSGAEKVEEENDDEVVVINNTDSESSNDFLLDTAGGITSDTDLTTLVDTTGSNGVNSDQLVSTDDINLDLTSNDTVDTTNNIDTSSLSGDDAILASLVADDENLNSNN